MQKHRNYFPFFKSGYYGTEDNTMQTANILRIFYNLVPEGYEKNVLQVLISDIKARDNHLDTGIIGTKHLFDVLMNYGYGEIAYSIATQKTYPSWGYMIDRGATTLWEYQEYRTEKSHNHIMLGGSIDEQFYEDLAGINIDPLFAMIWDGNNHTGQVSGVEEILQEANRNEIQVG